MASRLALVLSASVVLAAPAQAAGLWAKNYTEALKVAADTGRPILLLFTPDDPKVGMPMKKLLEDPQLDPFRSVFVFVHLPLKIVANKVSEPVLGRYYQGQFRWPLVIIGDGSEKLVYKIDGPQPIADIAVGLKTALIKYGPVANPAKAVDAAADVRRADALLAKQLYGPAARLYQEAVATKLKTPPVVAAKDKLAKIEDMANKDLTAARADVGDKAYPEAIEKLMEIDRKFYPAKAGQEARAELAKLRELPEAKAAYAAAEKKAAAGAETAPAAKAPSGPPLDPFTEEDLVALDEMGRPQAARTSPAAAAADPIEECRRLFSTAQSWIDNKEPAKAKPLLQKIVEQYPKTLYADQAKSLLEEMAK